MFASARPGAGVIPHQGFLIVCFAGSLRIQNSAMPSFQHHDAAAAVQVAGSRDVSLAVAILSHVTLAGVVPRESNEWHYSSWIFAAKLYFTV